MVEIVKQLGWTYVSTVAAQADMGAGFSYFFYFSCKTYNDFH